MGLYFSKKCKEGIVGFADAGYLSDPHTMVDHKPDMFLCVEEHLSHGVQ
jgi:hypothetical protein